jgi:MraZ protein
MSSANVTSGMPEGFKPLIGTEEATVDDKGRILVSKKKRDRLGDEFAIVFGTRGCLAAYPKAIWERMLDEILQHDSINEGREQYTRLLLGTAEDDLKFDAQNRVVVPLKMREAAKLKDKVLLVGCLDRVEIWAKDEYELFQQDPDTYGRHRREAIAKAYNAMVGR